MQKDNRKQQKHFDAISVSIASPDHIMKWSNGEVTKPETINYRTQKPERDGLFCERIFGPTKNWECYCGKYKKIIYKGVICEKCGVEVTRNSVRRERMAHIDLAVPVAHIWFLRSTPSRIGLLLDLPIKSLEQVVYFAAYIIKSVDEESKEAVKLQLDEEYQTYTKKTKEALKLKIKEAKAQIEDKNDLEETLQRLDDEGVEQLDELADSYDRAKGELKSIMVNAVISELEYRELSMKFGHVFTAGIGAEALRDIIEGMDLAEFIALREEELKTATEMKQKKIFKRIRLAASLQRNDIRPEWMIMKVLPVIPPDLRPMVQLDGGRYAASDLNDLYRRVINRNNRLKKLMRLGAPEVICRNEKRMLQEAVDTLLNNSVRSGKAAFTSNDRRKLRSLSDMLKGKQGRFRQNLLGKRVDYSGRSVIVVGPQLKLHQCGIPKEMALKLFKPFVIGNLIEDGLAHNVKNAERVITAGRKEVWDILEKVTQDHYVLLNRAPTLHRLSIQAFQPVLIEGKAIQIHPLVCAAFNADFDGDQMAVHVPLSKLAQREAKRLMKSSVNLLKPSAGEPITNATQDMVMGCYFLTRALPGKPGEGKVYRDIEAAMMDYELGGVHLQAQIKVRMDLGNGVEHVETSLGRLIFHERITLPVELPFKNYDFKKGELKDLVAECFNERTHEQTALMCDAIKDIGFDFATKSGLTVAASDMLVPDGRKKIIDAASLVVKKNNDFYWKGWVTADERYRYNLGVWTKAKNDITKTLVDTFAENTENDLYYQINSGARGNWGQITQLCGMKGLVANPSGKTIELPILSNLKDGFSILEYFIATHGGRKGKSDTALKTAEAGYLTRRLVDAVQDVIIRENDCGQKYTFLIDRARSEDIGVAFETRIFGRTLAEDLMDVKGKVIFKKKTVLGHDEMVILKDYEVNDAYVRSIMTCVTENGVCQKCYGLDLGTNKPVQLGLAAGIIAAQSIGEPGTQLTMRTFHMGGVAEAADITQGLPRVEELLEARPPKKAAVLSEINGVVTLKRSKTAIEIIVSETEVGSDNYHVPHGFKLEVKKGDEVREKQVLARSPIYNYLVRAKFAGVVKESGKSGIVVQHAERREVSYKLGPRASILISNNQEVTIGQPLTNGAFDLHEYMMKTDIPTAQAYIMKGVQGIYASQGQTINDKHIEIIVKQMFSKVRVQDQGDSEFLPGQVVDNIKFNRVNAELAKAKKVPAYGDRILLGLTRIAFHTDSWLSSASFQETIRVLVDAAVTKRVDNLEGLKENVIIGRLINAGHVYRKKLGMEDDFYKEDAVETKTEDEVADEKKEEVKA
ncbi:MAG: DNA-directed RNA polymerase subunit beta' [Candidatus Gracilibacteria bacterium]|nr:DNA-directed RNA polymerase subunit beta' [Candidatus Gracilibacteria bacterium]